jgi:CCR4-NOT transcription complex subunit 3
LKSDLLSVIVGFLQLMERFKVIERENKTKAYSKEGLLAAQKLDPTTKEREELNTWLMSSIDALQLQMDQFESEVEFILTAKKKRLDKVKRDRLEELQGVLERHKFHSGKLETLMRMLHNLLMDVNAGCVSIFDSLLRSFNSDPHKYRIGV